LQYREGTALNLVPPAGQMPSVADTNRIDFSLLWRPTQQLRVDNAYLRTALDTKTGVSIFDNKIVRSSWNYQFTRKNSLRVIAQYDITRAGPATRLVDDKNLNVDVLLRYVINPLSAVYAGFNTNRSNFNIIEAEHGERQLVQSSDLNKDGEQLLAKFSYLFQR
jgi:hypothetical protein